MNITPITQNLRPLISNNLSKKHQTPQLGYQSKDIISFSGKKKYDEVPTPYGIDYSGISNLDTKRDKTVMELREALKNGEDIAEDRAKLILSRIPSAIEDGEEFSKQHQEFESSDVIQELVRITIEETDKDLESNAKYSIFKSDYLSKRDTYFNNLLKNREKEDELLVYNASGETESTEDIVEKKMRDEYLYDIVKTLSPRRKEFIENYYGFNQHKPLSCKEIGQKFDVSNSRVYELRATSLYKIKTSREYSKKLKDFKEDF